MESLLIRKTFLKCSSFIYYKPDTFSICLSLSASIRGEDNEGEWSLKELFTSGQGYKKKAYYKNTEFKYAYEREKRIHLAIKNV